jgi:hypothetical protein
MPMWVLGSVSSPISPIPSPILSNSATGPATSGSSSTRARETTFVESLPAPDHRRSTTRPRSCAA